MMRRGRHMIKSYMTLEYEFTGIRIQDSYLTPVDWKLTVNLIAPARRGKSKESQELKLSNIYQRLYFWLDTNLPNIIIADVCSENDLILSNLSANIMMYCPGATGDDLVIQLLHSKLTALAGKDLIVGEMQLKGSDATLQYTFDCVDNEYSLPSTTKDYYPDGIAKDKLPWWKRNDGFCFEFIRPEETELSDEELFSGITDPMDEFEKVMSEINSETIVQEQIEPAKIVKVEKWTPRKVE